MTTVRWVQQTPRSLTLIGCGLGLIVIGVTLELMQVAPAWLTPLMSLPTLALVMMGARARRITQEPAPVTLEQRASYAMLLRAEAVSLALVVAIGMLIAWYGIEGGGGTPHVTKPLVILILIVIFVALRVWKTRRAAKLLASLRGEILG